MKNMKSQLNKLDVRPKSKSKKIQKPSLNQTNRTGNLSPLIKAMALSDKTSKTVTSNGAITPKSSGDKVLDFFAQGGALRGKSESEVISVFQKACLENLGLALKALFYIRDVRGGQGERKTFRTCLKWLAANYPLFVRNNLANIPFYGRWDDLFVLLDTSVEKEMMVFVNNQLFEDMSSEKPSLLGKWMESENASSKEGRQTALKFAAFMGLTPKQYRKILSYLRAKIKIVESQMCQNEWESISYDKIPSRAGFLYRKAFGRHDQERYAKYLSSVEKGEAKINTSTLYPYDIVRNILAGSYDKTTDVMWNNLPDYFEGKTSSLLPLIDVSSSMLGGSKPRPMDASISLGIYVAERNVGPFQNWFITFETSPKLQTVTGANIYEKVMSVKNASWGGSTNLQAAFELILNFAVKNKIKQKDMPKKLIIFSDMGFNQADKNARTNLQAISRKYKAAGYSRPEIIFWNLNASPNQSPAKMDDDGVMLVSGCSPSIIKHILSGKITNPYEEMLKVLNSERYNRVIF